MTGVAERAERFGLRVHQGLYIASDGRIGHDLLGVPCLLLRTTGRRSGLERTNALVYVQAGADLVVVASNGGADRSPAWLHNLSAQPDVEIQIGRRRRRARARVVGPGEEHATLWRLVNAQNRDRYNRYQTRTRRVIPLVVLTPTAP